MQGIIMQLFLILSRFVSSFAFGMSFCLVPNLLSNFGISDWQILSILILDQILCMIISSFLTLHLLRFSKKLFFILGLASQASGMLIAQAAGLWDINTSICLILFSKILIGFGTGIYFPTINSILLTNYSSDPEHIIAISEVASGTGAFLSTFYVYYFGSQDLFVPYSLAVGMIFIYIAGAFLLINFTKLNENHRANFSQNNKISIATAYKLLTKPVFII